VFDKEKIAKVLSRNTKERIPGPFLEISSSQPPGGREELSLHDYPLPTPPERARDCNGAKAVSERSFTTQELHQKTPSPKPPAWGRGIFWCYLSVVKEPLRQHCPINCGVTTTPSPPVFHTDGATPPQAKGASTTPQSVPPFGRGRGIGPGQEQ
jgi:hypothetical protein